MQFRSRDWFDEFIRKALAEADKERSMRITLGGRR